MAALNLRGKSDWQGAGSSAVLGGGDREFVHGDTRPVECGPVHAAAVGGAA